MAYNSKFTGAQIDALLDASEAMKTSKEDVANKVTALGVYADDVHYPSAKAVKDKLTELDEKVDGKYVNPITEGSVADVANLQKIYNKEDGNAARLIVVASIIENFGIGIVGGSGWADQVLFSNNGIVSYAAIEVHETDKGLWLFANGINPITCDYKIFDVTGDSSLEEKIKNTAFDDDVLIGDGLVQKNEHLNAKIDKYKVEQDGKISGLEEKHELNVNRITSLFSKEVIKEEYEVITGSPSNLVAIPEGAYMITKVLDLSHLQEGKVYLMFIKWMGSVTQLYSSKILRNGKWDYTFFETHTKRPNEIHIYKLTESVISGFNGDVCVMTMDNGQATTVGVYLYDVTGLTDTQISALNADDMCNEGKEVIFNYNGEIVDYINQTPYTNKKWTAIGDSLTESWATGGFYLPIVKKHFGLSEYKNCGISGTTMSGIGTLAMWQDVRINDVDIDSDLITIFAGTNDIYQGYFETNPDTGNKGWGEMTLNNHDITTFVGAYNVAISKLYYKFLADFSSIYDDVDYSGVIKATTNRNIRIVLVTPTRRYDNSGGDFSYETVQRYQETVVDKVKEIAKLWGLPCVDLYNEPSINTVNKYEYFTRDELLHPNQKAHTLFANAIIHTINHWFVE